MESTRHLSPIFGIKTKPIPPQDRPAGVNGSVKFRNLVKAYPEWVRDHAAISGERIGCTDVTVRLEHLGSVSRHSTLSSGVGNDKCFAQYLASKGVDRSVYSDYGNAVLRPRTVYKGLDNYRKRETFYDEEAFKTAVSFMEQHFGPYMSGSRIISSSESVQNLDESKSPGWPWNIKHGDTESFLNSGDSWYLEKHWDLCSRADYAGSMFASCPKDELRPEEKVRMEKTRVIHGAPVEIKVNLSRFCLDMNERFYDSHLRTASAVGLNPFSGGWARVHKKLSAHARGFALDEREYDGSIHEPLLRAIARARWGWLSSDPQATETNKTRFFNMYEDVIRTKHITPLGDVFETEQGNPSGTPNTVVDNTLALFTLLAYAWVKKTGGTYAQFLKFVAMALYGDDNTLTVDEDYIGIFNGHTIRDAFAEHGVEVKDENLDPRPLLELDFLKKRFVPYGKDIVFAPLDGWKHVTSLYIRSKKRATPAMRLGRACAVRQLIFFTDAFDIVDGWCVKLIREYRGPLTKEWLEALAQYFSITHLAATFLPPMEAGERQMLHIPIVEVSSTGGCLEDLNEMGLCNVGQQEEREEPEEMRLLGYGDVIPEVEGQLPNRDGCVGHQIAAAVDNAPLGDVIPRRDVVQAKVEKSPPDSYFLGGAGLLENSLNMNLGTPPQGAGPNWARNRQRKLAARRNRGGQQQQQQQRQQPQQQQRQSPNRATGMRASMSRTYEAGDIDVTVADFALNSTGNSARLVSAKITVLVTNKSATGVSGLVTYVVRGQTGSEDAPLVVSGGPFKAIDAHLLEIRPDVLDDDADHPRRYRIKVDATVEFSMRTVVD